MEGRVPRALRARERVCGEQCSLRSRGSGMYTYWTHASEASTLRLLPSRAAKRRSSPPIYRSLYRGLSFERVVFEDRASHTLPAAHLHRVAGLKVLASLACPRYVYIGPPVCTGGPLFKWDFYSNRALYIHTGPTRAKRALFRPTPSRGPKGRTFRPTQQWVVSMA